MSGLFGLARYVDVGLAGWVYLRRIMISVGLGGRGDVSAVRRGPCFARGASRGVRVCVCVSFW